MAPRKPTARKSEQHELDEFAEKYEILSSVYKDPVETLFEIMVHENASMELRANVAGRLMEFRFPKLKALENKGITPGEPVVLNIHLNPSDKPKEVDVTPPRIQLEMPK